MRKLKHVNNHRDRGLLLHLFMNHEILAIELMALAILKFPEAPESFRRNLLHTIRDEQRHATMYLNRMQECGVQLGEMEVGSTFWNHLSAMESPLQYACGMALTFEQANLDFALIYEKRFEEAGDGATAAILRKVHEDELHHVRVGVQLLDEHRGERSQWEVYTKHLLPNLSPARAKVGQPDRQSRLDCGLDEDFVTHLREFQRSKGRPPDVHWFNALDGELVKHVKSKDPRKEVEKDLETAMVWLASRDDAVLFKRKPSPWFREHVLEREDLGVECRSVSEGCGHGKVGALRPWVWSSTTAASFTKVHQTRPLHGSLSPGGLESLSSKAFTLEMEKVLGSSHAQVIDSLDAIPRGEQAWLLKSLHSHSGAGHRVLRGDLEKQRASLEGRLRREGQLLLEPLHHREADFSHLGHFDGKVLRWQGHTRMIVDSKGVYRGAQLNALWHGLEEPLRLALHQGGRPVWEQPLQKLEAFLVDTFSRTGFRGPFGIDAYLYQDDAGGLQYRCGCELNPRTTFGFIAKALESRVLKGAKARFLILPKAQRDLSSLTGQQERVGPLWKSGFFPVTDVFSALRFEGWVLVGQGDEELHRWETQMKAHQAVSGS